MECRDGTRVERTNGRVERWNREQRENVEMGCEDEVER